MTAGIYRFINNRAGEVYVGQSFNVYARRGKHHKELALGTHHNKGLQEDHNRGDTFTFEVLEKMPEATREELEEREIYYIEKFNSFYEGYNQTPGGEYDKLKGKYEYGGDRLPFHKYEPIPKPKLLDACPECGSKLVKKKGEYGNFAGCSNYPKCNFTCSVKKVNFKPKQSSYVSTKYNPNTYVPPVKSVPCKFCGRLIKDTHTTCPFCNELLIETPFHEQKTPSKTKTKSIKKIPLKTEFEKFCTKKNNYLTKADCDYLADKYDIDISTVNTVKKANPIIKNYLTKNNQWEDAIENLYKHYENQNIIGAFVLGHCPKCNGKLLRKSKFFIECENSSECGFSCTNTYYEDYILYPKSNITYSSKEQDSKPKEDLNSKQNAPKESTTKIVNYYGYWNNKVSIEKISKEDNTNKITTNKSKQNKNMKSPNSFTKYENVRYCSNCGGKIDLNNNYCENCGEKVNNTIINKQKNKSSQNSENNSWSTVILVIIFIIFIISFAIASSDVEGPISTLASLIFVGILCFGCYAGSQ